MKRRKKGDSKKDLIDNAIFSKGEKDERLFVKGKKTKNKKKKTTNPDNHVTMLLCKCQSKPR